MLPSAADLLAAAPPVRVEPGARQQIRAAHTRSGRRIAVLDDDPTGSQTVHDVSVVTVFDDGVRGRAARRRLDLFHPDQHPQPARVRRRSSSPRVAGSLSGSAPGWAPPSTSSAAATPPSAATSSPRSAPSTPRGRAVTGSGYDGVLLIPAYFEAGRFTAGDIHWAHVGGELVPVGDERVRPGRHASAMPSSDLRDFVAEKSGGAISRRDVASISLEDIRLGGPPRVAEILRDVSGGAFVVVNATDYADLEIVVLGLLDAEERGRSFLFRTGPSFVRALCGHRTARPADVRRDLARRPSRRARSRRRRLARRAHQSAGGGRGNAGASPRSNCTSPPWPTRTGGTPTSPRPRQGRGGARRL